MTLLYCMYCMKDYKLSFCYITVGCTRMNQFLCTLCLLTLIFQPALPPKSFNKKKKN